MRSAIALSLALCTLPLRAAAGPSDPLPAAPLVDIAALVPGIRIDLRYATADNVFKKRLYAGRTALLRKPVAQRLARAQRALARRGLGIVVWDAYRPRSVQAELWAALPDPRYVAPPSKGSHHSRGAAVDVGLVDREGRLLELPTAYDEAGPRAHRGARRGVSREARANSAILERAMVSAGFVPLPTEWWHFTAPDAASFPASDRPVP
jgi:zinc D-Ala-D-Ala dipeptidase